MTVTVPELIQGRPVVDERCTRERPGGDTVTRPLTHRQAHAYARRKTRTPDPAPPTPGQLEITDPDTPPGQIGPNDPWPEDFF